MISQTAEYALRAVVYLSDQEQARTTSAIAEKTELPVGYLSKVMQGLVKSGLVHSQRGLHGGTEDQPHRIVVADSLREREPA